MDRRTDGRTDGQTDLTKLGDVFSKFANAPKMESKLKGNSRKK